MASEERVTKTWAIATEGMCQMMEEIGISTRDSNPEYVVLGYDTEIDYEKYRPVQSTCTKAFHWLQAIQTWCALHRMEGCLTLEHTCYAKGNNWKNPIHITGKPNPGMIMHKSRGIGPRPF